MENTKPVVEQKEGGSDKNTAIFSIADQPARFAKDKAAGNKRVLDIDSIFDGSQLKGKVVLVTGGNRGVGLALVKELSANEAIVFATSRSPAPELNELPGVTNIDGIDVRSDEAMVKLVEALGDSTLDILVNNAGYFYGPVENLDSLAFAEETVCVCK